MRSWTLLAPAAAVVTVWMAAVGVDAAPRQFLDDEHTQLLQVRGADMDLGPVGEAGTAAGAGAGASVPEGCPTGAVFVSTTTIDITVYVTATEEPCPPEDETPAAVPTTTATATATVKTVTTAPGAAPAPSSSSTTTTTTVDYAPPTQAVVVDTQRPQTVLVSTGGGGGGPTTTTVIATTMTPATPNLENPETQDSVTGPDTLLTTSTSTSTVTPADVVTVASTSTSTPPLPSLTTSTLTSTTTSTLTRTRTTQPMVQPPVTSTPYNPINNNNGHDDYHGNGNGHGGNDNDDCVIDTAAVTPVTKTTLSSTPELTVTVTSTIFPHDQATGKPSPAVAYCGVKGEPAGTYFIAEFIENRPGVPVTEEGCYQFCNSVLEDTKGCKAYRFYPNELGAPRCKLYGMPVSYDVRDIDNHQPGAWYDLACGPPSGRSPWSASTKASTAPTTDQRSQGPPARQNFVAHEDISHDGSSSSSSSSSTTSQRRPEDSLGRANGGSPGAQQHQPQQHNDKFNAHPVDNAGPVDNAQQVANNNHQPQHNAQPGTNVQPPASHPQPQAPANGGGSSSSSSSNNNPVDAKRVATTPSGGDGSSSSSSGGLLGLGIGPLRI